MNTPKKRLLIFDLQGTLIDSRNPLFQCICRVAAQMQLEPIKRHKLTDSALSHLIWSAREWYPELPNHSTVLFVQSVKDCFEQSHTVDEMMVPHALTTLAELKQRGYILAIATSMGRESLDQLLQNTGLSSLISISRCASDGYDKPDPQMITDIAEKCDIPLDHIVMIGDHEVDFEMADAASVDAIAANYAVGMPIEFTSRHGVIKVLQDIRDLLDIFAA